MKRHALGFLMAWHVALGAGGADVLLLRQVVGSPAQGTDQRTVDGFTDRLRQRLGAAGVPTQTLNQSAVSAEALRPYRIVLLPYNPELPAAAAAALEAYVANGGKLGLFYCGDPQVLRLLGVQETRYRGRGDLPSIGGVAVIPDTLPQAPAFLPQRSWNVLQPIPAAQGGVTVVGTWRAADGSDTGIPAALLHAKGFYFGHVYLDEDAAAGERFLLALLDAATPGLWADTVRRRLSGALGFHACSDLASLEEAAAASGRSDALVACRRAAAERGRAEAFLDGGRFGEALEAARAYADSAADAYLRSRGSRSGELRGAWIHSGYGIGDWGWDRTIKVLAENGFNAVFPNLCWGAVADYPSEVLPVHPKVAEHGDQLAACLAACRRYGVELHVWRVNWNMGHHTPAAVREQFVRAGRVQVDYAGASSTFLAPHLEENFAHERDAMLEIVRRYPVDGIHFDYIRYPGESCDFSDSARASFEAWHGSPVPDWPRDCRRGGALREPYNAWRRSHINRLVRTVYEEAHRIRDDIRVSAAVYGLWESARDSVAQSAAEWIENGWLDFVCPMNYTTSDASLRRWLEAQVAAVDGRVPIYCGIGSWQHASPAQTAGQIDLSRRLGAAGFVCFALNRPFAEQTLPALALGVTREAAGALLPHHPSLHPRFVLSAGDPDLEGAFALGERLTVTAYLTAPAADFQPQVSVLRDGLPVDDGHALQVRRRGLEARCRIVAAEPGAYVVEIRGTASPLRGAAPVPLLARSTPVRVLDDEARQGILRLAAAPDFGRRRGIRVGVWHRDAYGAAPILDSLRGQPGILAEPLFNLKESSLRACDVVILPQPRQQAEWFKDPERMAAVRAFLRRGGGVLVTHALVGVRGFVNAMPEVAGAGVPIAGSAWRVAGPHPVTMGIPHTVSESPFDDRISVVPAPGAVALLATPEGTAIAAAGRVGRGRGISCGLAMGVGADDADVPLTEAEAFFLVQAVKWLAGGL